jgi:hypothetical protein
MTCCVEDNEQGPAWLTVQHLVLFSKPDVHMHVHTRASMRIRQRFANVFATKLMCSIAKFVIVFTE